MKWRGLWLGLLALLLLWPAAVVFADDPGVPFDGGQIFVDEDVTLESGETFDGDLGVFDGNLTMSRGSTVNGDVFVTNGDVDIAGRVNGNVAIISGDLLLAETGQVQGDVFAMSGGQEIEGRVKGDVSVMFGDLELRSTAVLEGDMMVLSGRLERDPGAQVMGQEMPEIPLPALPFLRGMPEGVPRLVPPATPVPPSPPVPPRVVPPVPPVPHRLPQGAVGHPIGRFVGRTFTAGILSLLFIALGLLIAFIWPRATHRVADCIATLPVQSFGLGLLTFLIAAGLEALAAVLMILIILVAAALIATVILIPIGLLLIVLSVFVLLPVPLALVGAMILGWVSLAEVVGQKVLKVLHVQDVTPLGAVLVGLLVTVPLVAVLWIISPGCCGWPFVILLTSVGLGAVFHTRFGTQSCRQSQPLAEAEILPLEAMDEEAGQPDSPVA